MRLISYAEWLSKQRMGYAVIVDGQKGVYVRDVVTGTTILVPVEIEPVEQNCDWCGTLTENIPGVPTLCGCCGHRSDVGCVNCDCSRCQGEALTILGGADYWPGGRKWRGEH